MRGNLKNYIVGLFYKGIGVLIVMLVLSRLYVKGIVIFVEIVLLNY